MLNLLHAYTGWPVDVSQLSLGKHSFLVSEIVVEAAKCSRSTIVVSIWGDSSHSSWTNFDFGSCFGVLGGFSGRSEP